MEKGGSDRDLSSHCWSEQSLIFGEVQSEREETGITSSGAILAEAHEIRAPRYGAW